MKFSSEDQICTHRDLPGFASWVLGLKAGMNVPGLKDRYLETMNTYILSKVYNEMKWVCICRDSDGHHDWDPGAASNLEEVIGCRVSWKPRTDHNVCQVEAIHTCSNDICIRRYK